MALALGLGASPASPPASPASAAIVAVEREQQALFDAVAPSVVFIRGPDGVGSGFFVTGSGLILTNVHVVGRGSKVDVVLLDGRRFAGDVVERASGNIDLALIQIPVTNVPALPLDTLTDVRVGSFVASVGHGEGELWTFNVGMVSNIHALGAEKPVIQTQIPLNRGNSGGPIVNSQGRVIGIVTAGIKDTNAINFAIRADVAARSLSRLAPTTGMLVIDAPAGAQLFLDGKLVGTGPRVATPCAEGAHRLEVLSGGVLTPRSVACPAPGPVSIP